MPGELVSNDARTIDDPSDRKVHNALPTRGRRNQSSYTNVIEYLDTIREPDLKI